VATNDGRWNWNNVQQAVVTCYHKFNSRWHMDTEGWYMWQSRTPNVANPGGAALIAAAFPNATYGPPNGAICPRAELTCYSYSWAFLNYIIELRPELRYDRARDAEAYDNPTQTAGAGRNSQVIFAADAIFHF
jgi:hypothetical protein